MNNKAVILKVYGKVQGVGFRFYTQKRAQELSLKGFVQNKTDGSVYIEAEGEAAHLEMFVLWCDEGPSWARVTKVEKQFVPVLERDEGFFIR
ncbi:MAG: acylphosphatase [Bacteroidetes bacterium]|nr:MAG: acylphosphatase [Bacteroidota bacterium]